MPFELVEFRSHKVARGFSAVRNLPVYARVPMALIRHQRGQRRRNSLPPRVKAPSSPIWPAQYLGNQSRSIRLLLNRRVPRGFKPAKMGNAPPMKC